MASGDHILNDEFIGSIKKAVCDKDMEVLSRLIDELAAADVADLIEHLDKEERMTVFDLLEPEGAGEVLVEIEPPLQGSILDNLDNQALMEIVKELDSDDAADLVGDLSEERANEIMGSLQDDVSEELEKLLPYKDDTAGGLMALEFVAVRSSVTVEEAIERIREKREEVENLYYLFTMDDEDRLDGVVSLKDLVLASPETRVSEIMNPEVLSVHVSMDQEDVAHMFKKYDLVSIPVVDDFNRLVGRITHDDIIDVIEDEADEDITLMAGVISSELTGESPLRISRARLPWLVAGLFGGILAAVVINQFEDSLEKMIALSFFFPVVMAMAGNTGTQAAAVAVRGLATGDIGMVNIGKRLWLELKVALLNGIICGILLGVIVGFWLSDYGLGAVVALAQILIIVNSGFIGAAVPFAFKKINVDPALATGPFVTTTNDIMGLFIYLGMVTLFLFVTG